MAFQTRDLWLTTLGVQGDVPPDTLQPALPDGMHLRWSFDPAKGFPWHGYHLFRRPSRRDDEDRTCLSRHLGQVRPGPLGTAQLAIGPGTLSSDRPLVLTEDFPPAGVPEVDLADRSYVRYAWSPAQVAWRVRVTVGFRRPARPDGELLCVDLRDEQPGTVPNPMERDGARFVATSFDGSQPPDGRLVPVAGAVGWDVGFHGRVDLPCAADEVELVLAHSATAPKVVALDAAGDTVDTTGMSGGGPETLTLSGPGITAVLVEAPQDETVLMRICWSCTDEAVDDDVTIPVEARFGGVVMAATQVSGAPGAVRTVELTADAIDRVDLGRGRAALVDLCLSPVADGARGGWEPLDGFPQPLSLPVAHGDYPCPGAPPSAGDAEDVALGRITYGPAAPWSGSRFAEIHDRLERLVVGGPPPGGEPMHARTEPVTGSPAPPPEVGGAITQQRQRPLELVLLGSLRPPVAQMLGLAWLDRTADPGTSYDYLLVADHDGALGGSAASALDWVRHVWDFSVADGVVVFDRVVGPAAPLPAPTDIRAYSLPGATAATDVGLGLLDATNNAGLTWDRHLVGTVLTPGAPVMYHVWRADLGDADSPADPAPGDFDAITRHAPLPVGRSVLDPPQVVPQPGEWPPFPMQYIDRARPDGWYAYRVNGVDVFGRHSSASAAAGWFRWSPAVLVHGSRIRLRDKVPPPPPTGVEASALDPDDPTVLQDAAWQAWRASLSEAERAGVVGLRVRWRWDVAQQRQAPDTREFRIYYQPAPVNTLRGRVTSVVPAGATESDVVTDIPHGQPADGFAGLSVRVGAQSFRVVASSAASPLRLRVRNIGPTDDVVPPSRTRCAVTVAPGHALHVDFAPAVPWDARLLTVDYEDHVTLDGTTRRYEVLLPVAGSSDRTGLPLVTTVVEPMSAALVGVTAADDKQHTADHRGDAARFGNESRVGGPATVLRVRRQKPPAPVMPPDSAKVWASPADYHGHSFYTYRWLPQPHLKTFVYRALDQALVQADLAARPRPALAPTDLQRFPAEADEPAWDALKRQQVAAELNALNGLDPTDRSAVRAAYASLSNDGLRVLAALPGTERAFVQLNTLPLDPDDAVVVGPDRPPGSVPAGQRTYVARLDGRARNRYFFRSASVDEVQNVGPLGLSSPPVWLPDVTAPAAPRIARVTGGERQVTLEWTSNREPDLAGYRIHRTFDREAARDVRLMKLVHSVAVAPGDPGARPATLGWTDDPVPGLRDVWYRVVAVDRVDSDPKGGGGNVSTPSPAVRARAFDQTPAEAPGIGSLAWTTVDGARAVRLTWAPAAAGVRLLVQLRGEYDDGFAPVSPWLAPGTTSYVHRTHRSAEQLTYRLKAVSAAGNANVVFHPSVLAPPA